MGEYETKSWQKNQLSISRTHQIIKSLWNGAGKKGNWCFSIEEDIIFNWEKNPKLISFYFWNLAAWENMYELQLGGETLYYQQLLIFIQNISSLSCEQSKTITFTKVMGSRRTNDGIWKILSYRWHIYCKHVNSSHHLCQNKTIHAEVADSSCLVLQKVSL